MGNDKGIGAAAAAVAVLALGAGVSCFPWPVAAPAAVVLIKAPSAGGMFIFRGLNPQIYFAWPLLGDQLDSMSITELEHLEQQLEGSLKQIRSRKNQLMFNSISEFQEKEKSLTDENRALQKLMEAEMKKASVTQAASPVRSV